jgi:hypothetical protein
MELYRQRRFGGHEIHIGLARAVGEAVNRRDHDAAGGHKRMILPRSYDDRPDHFALATT